MNSNHKLPYIPFYLLNLVFICSLCVEADTTERRIRVNELTPVGQQLGYAVEPRPNNTNRVNFYIVFPEANSGVEKVLHINERSGEIRLQSALDHEKEKELVVLVIPTDGSPSQKVIIEVEDANDHRPTFVTKNVQVEVSEQASIGTELPLPVAHDPDSPPFNVQKYRIAGGNVNNVFRISSRRLNNQLYADLVVNGNLDREYRSRYDLLIEAIDGGNQIGRLEVKCLILDANDNSPEFEKSRYSVSVPANATLGQAVIKVSARDADDGENSRLTYVLLHANYEPVYYYQINSETGQISVAISPLPSGTTHELLVIARDNGIQPLETSVFLTIHISDERNGEQSTDGLQITWLTDNGEPVLMENLTIGYLVARLELGDEYINGQKLSISGCDSLCLKETDTSRIYLLMVCGVLDRELHAFYSILFTLTDLKGQQILQHPVHVEVGDINDWAPEWSQPLYKLTFNRSYDEELEPKTVGKLTAYDRDAGENGRLRYMLLGTQLFQIHPETGILTATQPLNCSIPSEVRFRVVAEDHGQPSTSSTADVQIDLIDMETPPPLFERSLYEVRFKEDTEIGKCLVQIKAHSRGCGLNDSTSIRYSLQVGEHDDEEHLTRLFRLDPQTGRICLGAQVDYERRSRYQLTILSSQAGKNSTALVDLHVEDVNDHSAVFKPQAYHIVLREGQVYSESLLSVFASDDDGEDFGRLSYFIEEITNDGAKFRLDQDATTGYLYLERPLKGFKNQSIDEIQLKINARDGKGLTSLTPATVHVYIQGRNEPECISFSQPQYEFQATEDILPGIILGVLRTQPNSVTRRLELIAGDPNDQFRLDSKSGRLLVTKELDADHQNVYWLGVKATLFTSDGQSCVNYTQIKLKVLDANDNDPRFDMPAVKTSIPENYPIHEPFFAVQAIDKDRNENGRVTYELISSEPACPIIVKPLTGQLLLAAPLDYEQVKEYSLRIRAQDQGVPPRSSIINVTLVVLDINDFKPEFSSVVYNAEISEDAPLMTDVLKVEARDKDFGANSIIRYRIADEQVQDFGINSQTGEIFVRRSLDRERQADYRFLVLATDRGSPPLTSNASVHIRIADINDNSPNCSTIQRLQLNEQNNQHRYLIGKLNSQDLDEGPNGTVVYRLQKFNELFDLKQNGDLFLRRRISQIRESYRLSVIAEDQGPKPRSVVCQVLIKVEASPSEIVIQEPIERLIRFDSACGVGCPLVRLNATNVKRWSLDADQKISGFFDLTEDGLLKLSTKVVDSLDSDIFRRPEPLNIHLFDTHGQQTQLTLQMKHITRPRDNSSMVVYVSELSAPGQRITTSLGERHKTSKSNETSAYWMLNEENDVFEVDPVAATLYLRSRLNYTNSPSHVLKLTKYTPRGVPLNETTVLIDVKNENMNGPKFESSLFKFGVSEGTQIGSVLAQVEAIDRDEGDNGLLTYRIVGDSPVFNVDQKTGEIVLKQALQHHLQPKHFFVLEAADQPSNPSERRRASCVVVIEVEDTNNNSPTFLSSSSMTLLADLLPTDHPVHYFVATDPDTGDFGRVQYTIVNGNQPPMFVVNQQTGALTVLHRPTGSLVQLTVRASDSDQSMPRFTEQLFSIYVQANEAKWTYFSQPVYDFTLAASTIVGTPLVDFKRSSLEVSAQPIFKLLPQTVTDFELDERNGILKTNTDVLKHGLYRLTVHVTDLSQRLSDVTTVLIHVPEHRHQTGPRIAHETCSEVWVKEEEPVQKVTRVIATIDGKESREIFFQIEGGSGADLFTMNSTTGIISSKSLDREHISEHILVVSASDQGQPRRVDVCTIRIKILDQNDNPPEFTAQSPNHVEVTNEHQVGMVIAKFEAFDKDIDQNGKVIYKLGSDESGAFDINVESGELFLARDSPFLGNKWEIVVVAEDLGLSRVLHTEKRVQIVWRRGAPKIDKPKQLEFMRQNQTVTVVEGHPGGKFVLQIDTTAKFMGDSRRVEFKILEGNDGNAFQIDELGTLKTNKELDAESQPSYSLKVQASMSGNRKAIGFVTIRVLNTNDNAPSFPHVLHRRIEEDSPVGSLITGVLARDADVESTVEYSLAAPNEYFELQRATGDLFLLRELDYELMTEHTLSVQAFDGEYSTFTELKIQIIDINDNAPIFTSDLFEFTCPSSSTVEIGQVVAIDRDSGEFGRVEYELMGDDVNARIDRNTGLVSLLRPMKGNEERFISVRASDHGTPPHSTTSTIKLSSIPKLAKDTPQFIQQNYSFMVAEDFPLHLAFGQLSVKNLSGSPVACRFQIEDAEMSKLFEINAVGQISLLRFLDFETRSEYKTRVSVRNIFASAVGQTHVALLEIRVIDVNDNYAVFTKETQNLVIQVNETVPRGHTLATLHAIDADSTENGRIVYSALHTGDQSFWSSFSVDPSGVLRFERWNDDLMTDSLFYTLSNSTRIRRKLVVKAEDFGVPRTKWVLMELSLEFDLQAWSGTAPFFPIPSYRRFVLESQTNGSRLLRARATSKMGTEMPSGEWKYRLINNDEIFEINSATGEVFLNGQLDYEKLKNYEFTVIVTDNRGRSAIAPIYINVVGIDEFAPVFTKSAYTFQVPWSVKPGQKIGRVAATDLDAGVDGRIIYTLAIVSNVTRQQQQLIGIDPQTGVLLVRSSINSTLLNGTDSIELIVVASTSPTQFARATVLIEFDDNASIFVDTDKRNGDVSRVTKMFLAGLTLVLIVILAMLCAFCARFCSNRKGKTRKPRKQIYSVARGNIAVMTNVERLSPTYAAKSMSRFSSPTTVAATSLLSSSALSSTSSEGGQRAVDGRTSKVTTSRSTDVVRFREDYIPVTTAMSRSHGDSGIDADGISIGSLNDYLNQISSRSAAMSTSKTSSTFLDPANSELLHATCNESFRPSSHASNGIYDFPMRPTIKPLQLKRNLNNSYVASTRTFVGQQPAEHDHLLHGNAQP